MLGRRASRLIAVPLECFLQTFLKFHPGFVTKMLSGSPQVGERMFYVPRALRFIGELSLKAGKLFEDLKRLVQVETLSGRYIKHLAGDLLSRRFAGQQVGVHGIVHVREIAALCSVAEYCRGLAG